MALIMVVNLHRPWMVLCWTVLLLSVVCEALERDPNAPWGDKPPRKFKMFWKDASYVLDDLLEFDSLYIQHHGCAWSEYGIDNFDDDGEYRDGDENWYQGRTSSFRANAAYSLYGTLRKKSRNFGRKCTRKTYINTFFTTLGADTITNGLGLMGGDYGDNDNNNNGGHAYCYEPEDVDDDSAASTTMGCSLDNSGTYIMALFSDEYCDGAYFINTTASDSNNMKSYNQAMNKVSCEQVWDYNTYYQERRFLEDAADNNNGYADSSSSSFGSFGETLLQSSTACDLDLYGTQCPDPFGIKRQYQNAITGNVFSVRFGNAVTKPLRILSSVVLLIGIFLASIAYYIGNTQKVQNFVKQSTRELVKSTGLFGSTDDDDDEDDPNKTIRSPDNVVRSSRHKRKKRKRKKKKNGKEHNEEDLEQNGVFWRAEEQLPPQPS